MVSIDGDPLDRTRYPADPWGLVETSFSADDLGRTETVFAVGNGYLGLRGNLEEGRDSFAHGTFVNGFHETWSIRHAEEAFGFARVGQTIVNAPDAKLIKLYVDDEPLLLTIADLEQYSRVLDFKDGVLRRELIWRTPGGKRVQVRSERMVSFQTRHLAVLTIEVTLLDQPAPVVLSSQVLNRQDGQDEYHVSAAAMGEGEDPRKAQKFDQRVLQPKLAQAEDGKLFLGYKSTNSGMTIAVGAYHEIQTECRYSMDTSASDDEAKAVYRVLGEVGLPIKLTKLVAYHSSRGVPARELADRVRRTLDRAAHEGADEQFAAQRAWLDAFWARSDVEIADQPETQQAVRWNLFQVAQASARAEGVGIPAKGVTGSGYGGHYFWDTEIYVLPFLTYTSPPMARAALRFRYTMLDAARRRAADLNQKGALFPWRTISGEEASAYYAAGTAQYHIDADVSYALAQYIAATDDQDFISREAIDILVETARMWADLGFWRENGEGTFHIHGVTGPDEYTTVVNDNLFTNVMARYNLRLAAAAVRKMQTQDEATLARVVKHLGLDLEEVSEWERSAEKMAVPFNESLGIHPQDAHFLEREVWDLAATPKDKLPLLLNFHPLVIYRFQVLKQADVVLALFLHGDQFTLEEKRRNFEYYDPITTGDSTLSAVVQSIIAAEVGYHELALKYFNDALFVDLADLHNNTADGVHVASTGGIWSALTYGFGGFGDRLGRITLDPRLPETWSELAFRVTVRGSRARIAITQDAVTITIEEGEKITVHVRGEAVTATADAPAVRTLDDQGPRLGGGPGPTPEQGWRREDGSVMTASVPTS